MVPKLPTAQTSEEELPQTPLKSFIVPLETLDQLAPS
jgi:hypothetical protein